MPHTIDKDVFKTSYFDIKKSIENANPEMSPHDVRLETARILQPRFLQDLQSSKIETAGNQEKYGDQVVSIRNGDIFYPNYGEQGISCEELNERTLRLMPENYSLADHQASRLAAKTLAAGARLVVVEYVRAGTDNRDIQIFEINPQTGLGKTLTINTSTEGRLHTADQMREIMREKFPNLREINLDENINMFTDQPLPEKEMRLIVDSVQSETINDQHKDLNREDISSEQVQARRINVQSAETADILENKQMLSRYAEVDIQQVVQKIQPIDKQMKPDSQKLELNKQTNMKPVLRDKVKVMLTHFVDEIGSGKKDVEAKKVPPNTSKVISNITNKRGALLVKENRPYQKPKYKFIPGEIVHHPGERVQPKGILELKKRYKREIKDPRITFAVLLNEVHLNKKIENKKYHERLANLRRKHKLKSVAGREKKLMIKLGTGPDQNFERIKRNNPLNKEKYKKRLERRVSKPGMPELSKLLRKRLKARGLNIEKRRTGRVPTGKELQVKTIGGEVKKNPEKTVIKNQTKKERNIYFGSDRKNLVFTEILLKINADKAISKKERRRKTKEFVKQLTVAWTIWLYIRPEILKVTADLNTKNIGINQKELVPLGSRPFLLLSIIWYLAKLREHGLASMPNKRLKNNKKKMQKKFTSSLNFPSQGIIFSSFS